MKFAKKSPEQEETCPTCGKRIAEDSHSGSLTSYLFQSLNCSCGNLDERLTPRTDPPDKRGRGFFSKDSLGSFCPACGLQNEQSALGSITGFLFQDIRCKCRVDDGLVGDGMAERFWKLKEAEADKVFASVTKDLSSDDGRAKTSINLLPGAIIGGIYRIVSLLGRGGMGEVYLANHTTLSKNCALKVIPPDKVTDMSWQRFQNEAKAIAGLEHANLVKVTDLGLHHGCLPFYAMEYIDGVSLSQRLQAVGPLPLPVVLDIFMQVCDGVHHAHRKGVVHRDLKPANIMLVRTSGDKFLVKILDFGLVKLTQSDRDQQSLTRVGEIFGTPFYMSPEQCTAGKIDSRSDIYSIGCSMFEALTGRVPFMEASAIETITAHQSLDPPTLESVVGPNQFPVALEVVIVKLLRKNPVERYQNLLELRGDLEKVARGESVEPFYMSRAKRANEKKTVIEPPSFAPVSKERLGEINLSRKLAVAAVSLLVVAIAFAAYQLYANVMKPPVRAVTASSSLPGAFSTVAGAGERAENLGVPRADIVPSPGQGIPPEALDPTPYSSIVEENGRKLRVFHFPRAAMMGRIFDEKMTGGESVGTIVFPADARLTFTPEVDAINYPAYLKRFRSGDVYIGTLSKYSDEMSKDGALGAIRALAMIPGLQELDLRNSDDLNADGVAILDKFDSVKSIVLSKVGVDTLAFSRLSLLKRLRSLQMSGYYNVEPIISSLRTSPNIKKLSMPCSSVDLNGVESLATMPNLERLHLAQISPGDLETTVEALKILSQNKKLQELSIRNMIVRPQVVTALKAMPQLKVLRFSQAANGVSLALKHSLFKDLPALEIGPPYLDSGKLPR
jgi:serine/threonine protein kinase